jgi:hypothetical protein
MHHQLKHLELSLLLLRIGVFIVMFAWTLDKFISPEHAARVYESFYFIGGMGTTIMYLIGAIEMIIIRHVETLYLWFCHDCSRRFHLLLLGKVYDRH